MNTREWQENCAGCGEKIRTAFVPDYVNKTKWHSRCFSTALRAIACAQGLQVVGMPAPPVAPNKPEPKDPDALQDYEKRYEEFWKELVETPHGLLDPDKVKRELHDYSFLMEEVPKVYEHISGGLASKPNYYAHEMIPLADNHYETKAQNEIREFFDFLMSSDNWKLNKKGNWKWIGDGDMLRDWIEEFAPPKED